MHRVQDFGSDIMRRILVRGMHLLCVGLLGIAFFPAALRGAEMAMGFKVGEVTQNSAIVWTRVTLKSERVWDGYREPRKREPRRDQFVSSFIPVETREGAVPGAVGQVRVKCSPHNSRDGQQVTEWATVEPQHDCTHQFLLNGLKPGTRYNVTVEARDSAEAAVSATATGSFNTPAEKDDWQDVTFTVITGQSYWDLDHKEGFHIYPAMGQLEPDFIIPTGDTVYMDSEAPRARTVPLARYHWQRMYSLPRHIEFHRHVPGYWEVDDHDSWINDGWPTRSAPWMNPLTFEQGFRVFREQVPMGEKTYRTIRWGRGLQIWLVEGRLYRSPNNRPDGPEKTIWGKKQRDWLMQTILASDADFRVLISPTPIVGPDRPQGKADNLSNKAFAYEGNLFRNWTKEHNLKNFYVCCGDRHWQYVSIDPATGLYEFSCGPASDQHAGGNPAQPDWQPFLRVKGGFLSVTVKTADGLPTIAFRHHDVHGAVVHEFTARSDR